MAGGHEGDLNPPPKHDGDLHHHPSPHQEHSSLDDVRKTTFGPPEKHTHQEKASSVWARTLGKFKTYTAEVSSTILEKFRDVSKHLDVPIGTKDKGTKIADNICASLIEHSETRFNKAIVGLQKMSPDEFRRIQPAIDAQLARLGISTSRLQLTKPDEFDSEYHGYRLQFNSEGQYYSLRSNGSLVRKPRHELPELDQYIAYTRSELKDFNGRAKVLERQLDHLKKSSGTDAQLQWYESQIQNNKEHVDYNTKRIKELTNMNQEDRDAYNIAKRISDGCTSSSGGFNLLRQASCEIASHRSGHGLDLSTKLSKLSPYDPQNYAFLRKVNRELSVTGREVVGITGIYESNGYNDINDYELIPRGNLNEVERFVPWDVAHRFPPYNEYERLVVGVLNERYDHFEHTTLLNSKIAEQENKLKTSQDDIERKNAKQEVDRLKQDLEKANRDFTNNEHMHKLRFLKEEKKLLEQQEADLKAKEQKANEEARMRTTDLHRLKQDLLDAHSREQQHKGQATKGLIEYLETGLKTNKLDPRQVDERFGRQPGQKVDERFGERQGEHGSRRQDESVRPQEPTGTEGQSSQRLSPEEERRRRMEEEERDER